jgi:hypothetical protein
MCVVKACTTAHLRRQFYAVRSAARLLLLLVAAAAAQVPRAQMVGRVAWAALQGPVAAPPYTLAVCAMMHNEAFYLREWVLYHLLVGVQHFYLYDNDSTDNTREALQPFIQRGVVTYIPWPGEKGVAQHTQLAHCFNASVSPQPAKWLASFDIDEFLVVLSQPLSDAPLMGHDSYVLHDLLARFVTAKEGGILLDRMHFGSSGHQQRPAGLSINEYTSRVVNLTPRRMMGKPLVCLEALERVKGVHALEVKPPWSVVTADHTQWAAATEHHTFEPFRLNHYSSRSFDECLVKANDVRRKPGNWRRQAGKEHCEQMMEGTALFDAQEHGIDNFLRMSWYVDVLQAALKQLPPLRT